MIINKVDRPNADPSGALDKTFDLFIELGANDEQADFPVLYGSGLEGWVVRDLDESEESTSARSWRARPPRRCCGSSPTRHGRPLRDDRRAACRRRRSTRTRRS